MLRVKSIYKLIVLASIPAVLLAAACNDKQEDAMMKKAETPGAAMVKETPGAMMDKEGAAMEKPGAMMDKLPNQLFAAHFVDSYPKHGETFAQPPEKALINFNFTLGDPSSITVTKDGTRVNTSALAYGERNLSMSVAIPSNSGDGLYVVDYKACWPDRSCHDGRYAFMVDSKSKSSYQNFRGKGEVTINMEDIKFSPSTMVISKGTKVTWKNMDGVVHFVNTDPHPSHNALKDLNSLDIKKGESYSYTFNVLGEWGFHCSAHVPQKMAGRIIVE